MNSLNAWGGGAEQATGNSLVDLRQEKNSSLIVGGDWRGIGN